MNKEEQQSGKSIKSVKMNQFTEDFHLRTWTAGCYYFEEKVKQWIADGINLNKSDYQVGWCRSNHLTAFAAGFFVVNHTNTFDYIFANAAFADNMTIYIAIGLSLIIYLLLFIWAK